MAQTGGTGGAQTSGGTVSDTSPLPVPENWYDLRFEINGPAQDASMLLFAVALLFVSIFLFRESRHFLSWTQGTAKHRLQAYTGTHTLMAISGAILILWPPYWMWKQGLAPVDTLAFWSVSLFTWPRYFSQPVLIVAFCILAFAGIKYSTGFQIARLRSRLARATVAERSAPASGMTHGIVTLVALAADAVAIWQTIK